MKCFLLQVTYQTDLFLEKNKDLVVPEHQALLGASRCSFLSSLFPPVPQESSKSSKLSSIASGFKIQLQTLLETLSATEPHYVRCVKPNNVLKPGIFENNNVLQQLRCGGVLEAIRISCAGFPSRKLFREFIDRFSILAPEVLNGSYNEATACKKILEKSSLSGYQVGKTKVFLRAGQMAELDARRSEILGVSASVIQKKVRAYLNYKHFKLLRLSSIKIQAFYRGQVARYQYERVRRAAACLNIQKHSRKFLARKAYKNLYFSSVSIQAGIRGMTARKQLLFKKQMIAATVIQSQCRRFLVSRHYSRLKKAALATQCAWRAKIARRQLRKLKLASKETDALLEANNKLEKQVEELTWQLQKLQRGGANNIAGQVPVIQGVSVIDDESMNKLTSENEQLKALVATLEQKIDATEKKYEETNKLSEERLKQAMEAEMKIIELKSAMQRLEEKISDLETEDKILRQQALLSASSDNMSSQLPFTTSTPVQNGQQAQLASAPSSRFGRECKLLRNCL
ncbi:myosin XI B, ARABIDOPSIS THALIANA MYOSIN XI B, MYOSIN XI-8, MYOSIN XI B [Hibiscus trionum]|uniref:Myosin XI B, ARABIDOPSIS THALIANA MYOSIN XI B, MYOSIN XI-8, MYOSIN XI B n=1 Tax=Hibiscus trionum TaxID=183268 RepID=A0A9W7GRV3_HIBTR|nr:myosin XI B, ARABIDOPSIS THALIANA MYOSIN XI B, MYOSIN XI-8, MYOSIN XI B [Hibiscus trionum]